MHALYRPQGTGDEWTQTVGVSLEKLLQKILTLLLLACAGPAAADDASGFAAARQVFWRAIAAAYSVDGGAVHVEPATAHMAGPEFTALATGDLRAFRATIGGSGETVQGFASLSGGAPAFARFRHIGSDGIASLLMALAVLDPDTPFSMPEIVTRIAWTYPDFGVPVEVPGRTWSLEHTATGASLHWFTRNSTRSGALSFWQVTLHIDHHHKADIVRTDIANPFLLRGKVVR